MLPPSPVNPIWHPVLLSSSLYVRVKDVVIKGWPAFITDIWYSSTAPNLLVRMLFPILDSYSTLMNYIILKKSLHKATFQTGTPCACYNIANPLDTKAFALSSKDGQIPSDD